jgi:hypothetical protein
MDIGLTTSGCVYCHREQHAGNRHELPVDLQANRAFHEAFGENRKPGGQ